jgi:hypothetical protein
VHEGSAASSSHARSSSPAPRGGIDFSTPNLRASDEHRNVTPQSVTARLMFGNGTDSPTFGFGSFGGGGGPGIHTDGGNSPMPSPVQFSHANDRSPYASSSPSSSSLSYHNQLQRQQYSSSVTAASLSSPSLPLPVDEPFEPRDVGALLFELRASMAQHRLGCDICPVHFCE